MTSNASELKVSEDEDLQQFLEESLELLKEAGPLFEQSKYELAEEKATQVLRMLEPLMSRTDLGDEKQKGTIKYNVVAHIAHTYNRLCTVNIRRGELVHALQNAEKAIELCERIDNKPRAVALHACISVVYMELEDHDRVAEHLNTALEIAKRVEKQEAVPQILSNLGSLYARIHENDKALEHLRMSITLSEAKGDKRAVAICLGVIGIVHLNQNDFAAGIEHTLQAMDLYEEIGDESSFGHSLATLGNAYATPGWNGYDLDKAEDYLLRGIAVIEKYDTKKFEPFENLAGIYEQQGRWQEFATYYKKFHSIKEEIFSIETKRQAQNLEHRLELSTVQQKLELERARAQATDEILANILPLDITARLLNGEKKIADSYESVSVLFVDIVGFTYLTMQLAADELIDLLDIVFTRFDVICKKYGLEKIKTIGDAYMAVCGAPVACHDHALRTAQAAMEMLEDFELPRQFSKPINVGFRIGLHCGSIVAGIIGENKYSYDLWGDAVNTASRMEHYGEEDRIHVSEEFKVAFDSLNIAELRFVERGGIEIKGKGTMRTYFIERAETAV